MGTAVVGALRAVLGLDTAAFEAGLDQAQKELAKAGKQFETLGGRIAKVGVGLDLALTAPLIAFGKKSVDAFDESAKSVAGVEAALRSMGGAAGFTSQQLQDMAADLQKHGPFDDDQIMDKVTANLLTFGKVSGDVFRRAQQSAVDMSARLKEDLQASAIRVGKALNDPLKGLTALQRVGVSFTAGQKAVIAEMVKTNHVADAQKLILKELEREFGGQAQALAKTAWGRQQVAMNSFNDAMEDVGKTIRAIMPDVAKAIQAVADAFLGLPPAARQAIVVGAAMAAALGPLLTAFGGVVAILGKLGGVLASAASSTGVLAGAMRGLSASIVFFGPWALAIGAAAAALGLLYLGMKNQQSATKESKVLTEALDKATQNYGDAVAAAAMATGKAREEALKDVAVKKEQVKQALAAAQANLVQAKSTLALKQAELATTSDRPADASDPGNMASVVAANRLLRAENTVKLLQDSISRDMADIAKFDALLNAKPPKPVADADPAAKAKKGRKGPDPLKAAEHQRELEAQRAEYELERQITEAEAAGDEKRAQALQDQLYLQERIEAWRRAGLSDIGALIKAEQDLTAKQAMRTAEARKEWAQRNVEAIQAGAQAAEEARQKAMENSERLAQLRLEHELDIARIEGDPQRIAALEREMEVARKTAEYRAAGMGDIDAVLQASTDADQEEAAKKKAVFRDAIKGGFQAAMEGDFKGWFRSWMAERLTHAWEDSLNKLADSVMAIFKKIDWGSIFGGGSIFGSGPGGGGIWDTFKSGVGDVLSSVFGSAPALAGGGSFMVGGRGGVDRNFVGLNLTRGERVDVTPAGHQANGVRPGLVFAPTYNVKAQDERGFARTQRQLINEQKRALDRGFW